MSNSVFLLMVLLLYLLFSLPLLLSWPPPMIDEALFASTGKTLLDDGHLGTPLVRGLESRVYWQPPMFFVALAPVIKVSGYSLPALRIFSVVVGGVIIALVFFCGMKLANGVVGKVAALLLACDPYFVHNVKFVRMDGLCMLFIMLGLAVMVKPLFQSRPVNAFSAGLLVALSALTHPFGLVAAVAFGIYVLLQPGIVARERVQAFFMFLLPLVLGAVIWGIYILQDVGTSTLQMRYQLGRKDRPLALTFMNAVARYKNAPLSLVLPVAGVVFLAARAIRSRGKDILPALLLAGIMVAVLSKFEIPYHVYIAPIGAIASGMLLLGLWESGSRLRRLVALGCGVVFIVNGALVFGYLNFLFRTQLAADTDYAQFCQNVSGYLPRAARVCGWGSPCVYWGLRSGRPDIGFRDRTFLNGSCADELIRNIDYVILSRAFAPEGDERGLERQRADFSAICRRNHLGLRAAGHVGRRERYAYSAEVYQIIPIVDK